MLIETSTTEDTITRPVVVTIATKRRKHMCIAAALQTLVPEVREHRITGSNQSTAT